jgi:hypothetical protein
VSFHLVDSKSGNLAEYADVAAARSALVEWIAKQRGAGEPVVEQPEGQWTDSRLTIWIADEQGHVIKLNDLGPASAAIIVS